MIDEIEALRAEVVRLTIVNAQLRARAIAAEKVVNERGSGFITLGGDVRLVSGDSSASNGEIRLGEPPSSHWTGPVGDLTFRVFYDGEWWYSWEPLQERKRQNGEGE